MKRIIINSFLILALVLGLSSCVGEWLDIQPKNQIVLKDYWKSEADVEAGVASCYRTMLNDAFVYRLMYWGELRSDNISLGSPSTDESDLWNVNIQTANSITQWNSFYQVINYCNTVLYYAPQAKENDPDFKQFQYQAYLAEALTIRSLCYFYLVRTFGDVPLVLNPSKDDAQDFNVSQNTEREILDQLESDLKLAETYARDTWSTIPQTKGRVTKNAVRALLADIYLWDKKYPETITECNAVMADQLNPIVLMETPYMFTKVFYQGNSSESIFELNFNSDGIKNSMTSTMYGNTNKTGSYRVKGSAAILSSYSATDVRGASFLMPEILGRKIYKYEGQTVPYYFQNEVLKNDKETGGSNYNYRASGSTANWIFYRLSDIYLMKAEALAEAGTQDLRNEAVMLVNRTYLRANPNISDNDTLLGANFTTKAAVRKLVFDERRREFAFEGKRWFDLFRMVRYDGSATDVINYLLPGYSEPALVKEKLSQIGAWYLPINQAQMSVNKKLKQNDYYTSIFGSN